MSESEQEEVQNATENATEMAEGTSSSTDEGADEATEMPAHKRLQVEGKIDEGRQIRIGSPYQIQPDPWSHSAATVRPDSPLDTADKLLWTPDKCNPGLGME